MKTMFCVALVAIALPVLATAGSLKDQTFVNKLVADGEARVQLLAIETVALWLDGSSENWRIPLTRLMNTALNNSMLAGRPDPMLKALEPFENRPAGLLVLMLRERGLNLSPEDLFEGASFTLYLPYDTDAALGPVVSDRSGGGGR